MSELFHPPLTHLRFRFLGTSTSVGVPVIGCECKVCLSQNPKDDRSRSSGYLEGPFGKILIDAGPDLRQQALKENLKEVDAVIYTHAHLDHVVGFDELRAFCWRKEDPLPLHGSKETLESLAAMFPWAFTKKKVNSGYVYPSPIPFEGPFMIGELKVTPIEVRHGRVRTHGFRFDHPDSLSFAYISDVKEIPEESRALLRGIDILIIDSLREQEHPTHLSVAEALEIIELLGSPRAYLTHISHELDCATLSAKLPDSISIAYDGLTLDLQS
ncbi:MBL fold metallo-hydrolase [Akkermansiaceae bacterium]|nr:MBL fold metallo-hydrolase [Akkermansiaceae bacterium]MDB4314239.1 MBL fold metallo-hydrolase [Akkermansiaceae bacterium]MDB4804808.1 MBL fold metallo-hydrolase [Akkermansiaceae bacterium]